jgi:NitT/TauT family transport system substrate-binding protein
MYAIKKKLLIVLLLICPFQFFGCSPAKVLSPIKVQFQWTPSAQFAGFYAADQKGLYAEEGISVAFLDGGPEIDRWASVLSGEAQFGVAGADELILARSQGKPVRAIATIYRRSPIVFISLADAGITRPQDFIGKKIRTPANTIPSLKAMLAKVGISFDKVSVVTDLPSDLALFTTGDVPLWGVYLTGLYVYKVNIIYPEDYGVHFFADTIFTTDEMIANHPDLVTRFLRATLKGWSVVVENSNDVPQMVQKVMPAADLKAENDKMVLSLPLVNTGEDHIGWMKPEIWSEMESTLRTQGVLSPPLDISQVYDAQFLGLIYK